MSKRFLQKGFDIDNPVGAQMDSAEVDYESDNNDEDKKKRTAQLVFLFAFMLFALFSRSLYLQAFRGVYYRDLAENNRIREVVVRAPRGVIKDAKGEVLAQNTPSFDAVFVPIHFPTDQLQKETELRFLSSLLEMDFEEIRGLIEEQSGDDRNTYPLKENIPSDLALEIIERSSELPGIYISNTARRQYVDGKIFAHIVGYDGKITAKELEENPNYIMTDYIGKDGLEYVYESYLHGRHGARRFEVDSNNNIKEDLGIVNPIPGETLTLNVEADLQRKVTSVLEDILQKNEDATGAVAIALDPRDGAVRALVSLPSYDNNLFAEGISSPNYQDLINNERRPLLNRAIGGEYPPGSVFKPILAAAALQEGTIDEQTSLTCSGGIHIGQWAFPDWKTHGHTDVKKAIAESCDVFFYAVGGGWGNIPGLGIQRISQYGRLFGFGGVLGVDLPGEENGIMPDNNWKFKQFGEKWYIGDSYHASIGQGYVTATPLQIVSATAAIANGGTLFRPRLVDSISSRQTGQDQKVKPVRLQERIVDAKNAEIVREGMRETIISGSGSGRRLQQLQVSSAGKTGTAQFGIEDKTHSWFTSFAPYEDPEIAMVILVEGGGGGDVWSVPATKEIYEWLFDLESGTIVKEEDLKDNEEEISQEEDIDESIQQH